MWSWKFVLIYVLQRNRASESVFEEIILVPHFGSTKYAAV